MRNSRVRARTRTRAPSIEPSNTPNMTGIVRKLEARQLVERVRAASDKRVQFLALTPQGRGLVKQATVAGRGMDKAWLGRLSRAEQAMLVELLGKLTGVPA